MVSSCLTDNSSINASSNAYANGMSSCMYSANPASGATYPFSPMNIRMDTSPQYYGGLTSSNSRQQHLQQQQQQQYLQQSPQNSSYSSSPTASRPNTSPGSKSPASSKSSKSRSSYKHVPHRDKPPHLVQRRNARERRRVQAVNSAFSRLRRHIPYENRNKRLSKVKTLKIAMDYIEHLRQLIATYDSKMLSVQHPGMDKSKWQTPYVEISPQAARDNYYSSMYGQV